MISMYVLSRHHAGSKWRVSDIKVGMKKYGHEKIYIIYTCTGNMHAAYQMNERTKMHLFLFL